MSKISNLEAAGQIRLFDRAIFGFVKTAARVLKTKISDFK